LSLGGGQALAEDYAKAASAMLSPGTRAAVEVSKGPRLGRAAAVRVLPAPRLLPHGGYLGGGVFLSSLSLSFISVLFAEPLLAVPMPGVNIFRPIKPARSSLAEMHTRGY